MFAEECLASTAYDTDIPAFAFDVLEDSDLKPEDRQAILGQEQVRQRLKTMYVACMQVADPRRQRQLAESYLPIAAIVGDRATLKMIWRQLDGRTNESILNAYGLNSSTIAEKASGNAN